MGQAPAFERGEDIAARQCSACHAVTLTDTSTDPRAPHLRDLYKRYAIEDLRRAFLNGVHIGDPDMPTFRLSPDEVEALLTYLRTLNPCTQPASDAEAMKRCFAPL